MRSKKAEQPQDNRNTELYEALRQMEKERGISVEFMLSQIEKAIKTACKSNYNGNEDVLIRMDPDQGIFDVYLNKTVVEGIVSDTNKEIALEEARKISAGVMPGEKVGIKMNPKELGRIAVQTARSIIRQGIHDGEKGQVLAEYQSKLKEVVIATVERIEAGDKDTPTVSVRLGKSLITLPPSEHFPDEVLKEGDKIRVYIADIKTGGKEPRVFISRKHPDLVRKLFEAEVPEIAEGLVEIKSINREAGSRTKIAVYSKEPDVDAVGACIGQNGQRVRAIVEALNGEKIDIIEYSEDPVKFISAALSPAEVVRVDIDPTQERACRVAVPDSQLSLAIGNKGQNVRLAAKLTGWKIDIRPESAITEEEWQTPPAKAPATAAKETAEAETVQPAAEANTSAFADDDEIDIEELIANAQASAEAARKALTATEPETAEQAPTTDEPETAEQTPTADEPETAEQASTDNEAEEPEET